MKNEASSQLVLQDGKIGLRVNNAHAIFPAMLEEVSPKNADMIMTLLSLEGLPAANDVIGKPESPILPDDNELKYAILSR